MIRLAVRVHSDQADIVLAELLELAPAGVEEAHPDAGVVEYAVYGSPGELPSLHDIDAVVGDARVEISTTEVPDDWNERWRQFHRAVLIEAPHSSPAGDHPPVADLHVRPPWESPRAAHPRPLQEIVIDPGQAFGTGGHASTRLCLALLLALAEQTPSRGTVIDVGTGSGVLAIAAAQLGFQPVLALDHERESVQAARDNAAVNGQVIDVRRFDLRSQPLPLPSHDGLGSSVVLANLLRPLLLELADGMPVAPAQLVAGGLLVAEVDEVSAAFCQRLGMRERERRHEGEWAAVWLGAD